MRVGRGLSAGRLVITFDGKYTAPAVFAARDSSHTGLKRLSGFKPQSRRYACDADPTRG